MPPQARAPEPQVAVAGCECTDAELPHCEAAGPAGLPGGCCPAARRLPRSPRVLGWFKSISSSATPRVLAQHGGLAHLMLETQSLSLALRGHSSAVSSTTRCRCRMQLAPRAPGPRAPATWKPSPGGTFVLGAVQQAPGQSRSARVLQRGARSHAAQRFRGHVPNGCATSLFPAPGSLFPVPSRFPPSEEGRASISGRSPTDLPRPTRPTAPLGTDF